MKFDNQLRYAKVVIGEYDGRMPLSAWLKNFFRENKQMGSRDRKQLSSLVYSYFRLGFNNFPGLKERLYAAMSLSTDLADMYEYFGRPEVSFSETDIFPWKNELSKNIDEPQFSRSFLIQPDLFLRMRPGRYDKVVRSLEEAGVLYALCDKDCLSLPNTTPVDKILDMNADAVVQDKSSQRTGELILIAAERFADSDIALWDCCAASGGKSILAADLLGRLRLTATDIRETIINNLRLRFREAGILNYEAFVCDLSAPPSDMRGRMFDIIIADVPCSGSGTWARTPEQLYYFQSSKIQYYSSLQKSIVSSVVPYLKPGGMLVYLTCSVFEKENEDVVDHLQGEGLNLIRQKMFTGYFERADTLFGALFTNS